MMATIALSLDPEDLEALIDATYYLPTDHLPTDHLPQVASRWFDNCKVDA